MSIQTHSYGGKEASMRDEGILEFVENLRKKNQEE
jgi:hypothetical protein